MVKINLSNIIWRHCFGWKTTSGDDYIIALLPDPSGTEPTDLSPDVVPVQTLRLQLSQCWHILIKSINIDISLGLDASRHKTRPSTQVQHLNRVCRQVRQDISTSDWTGRWRWTNSWQTFSAEYNSLPFLAWRSCFRESSWRASWSAVRAVAIVTGWVRVEELGPGWDIYQCQPCDQTGYQEKSWTSHQTSLWDGIVLHNEYHQHGFKFLGIRNNIGFK